MGFLFQNVFAPYLLFFGLIALFAAGYLVKFNLIGMPRGEEMRLLVSYSSFAFLGTLSGGVFLVQGPYFMGEYLAGPEVAGNVSAILSTAFLLTYLPPQVLQSAMMPPLFSYEYGRNEKNYVKLMAEETTSLLILIIAVVVFPPSCSRQGDPLGNVRFRRWSGLLPRSHGSGGLHRLQPEYSCPKRHRVR